MITHRQLFLDHVAQTSDFPLMLEIEKASGIYLYDIQGKRYTDLIAGISVSNLGHCHPKIVEAVQNQASSYMHLMVYGEYVQSPQVKLATLISKHLPESLNSTYFTNSGTEAVEGAMKLAKRYTGRTEIVSCYNSYHGSSQGALSIMGSEVFKNSFRPLLPDCRLIRHSYIEDLVLITSKTAAIVIEPVQAEAGVRVSSYEYFQALKKRCKETGTLIILDEIQTGYGRTGSLWAFCQLGFVPDILLLAKGMGGGMPIGAFISSKEIMSVLKSNPILGHITTFGGHPVSCAAALACLETIVELQIWTSVKQKEQLFIKLLQHSLIKEVRSCGLLIAVEFESFEFLQSVITKCLENGLIIDWFLFCDNSMRLAPPLIISEVEIIESCEKIIWVLNQFV